MIASWRHISASILLALYLPIALALPLFHTHAVHKAFGGVLSYSMPGTGEADHSHADECSACKFASSHWLPDAGLYSTATNTSLVVPVHLVNTLPTAPAGLPASRAPPVYS